MDNRAVACSRREGRADAGHFLHIAVGPVAYVRPFWKLKEYLANHPLDTVFATAGFTINGERRSAVDIELVCDVVLTNANPTEDKVWMRVTANGSERRRAA